ncbi:hypothetical protein EMCRGX_G004033 [Ephydatia muelleri]
MSEDERKFDHPAEELHPVPVPNSSWKQIGIDLTGPLPTTTNGPEHQKHIDAFINLQEQYRAKATQNILCAQARQKLHYDTKHNTNSTFKVGNKVLKSNARNRHRMGGKIEKPWLGVYIIQKDMGKVVDDNIVDEVKELDNSAGEQEAANGKGMGDNFHHDKNDNDKEQGCQNEEQQSHSPEQREILEPLSVLEEQLYSPNILSMNAKLDLQQKEYALSKDIDVSLWIDFREFYGYFPLQEVLGGKFVVVNENLHAEFAEFNGKVLSYRAASSVEQIHQSPNMKNSVAAAAYRVSEITNEEHIEHNYQPVCSEWQKQARIAADGNCFFRSVSLAVTGSQTFHEELSADHNVHDSQINRSSVILPWIPRWLYGKLYEAIKEADSGHMGYRIGGDCSSIIA